MELEQFYSTASRLLPTPRGLKILKREAKAKSKILP